VQALHAAEHVLLVDSYARPERGERPSHEWKIALNLVEDARVDVVARNSKS
jgi:hypothetical protein